MTRPGIEPRSPGPPANTTHSDNITWNYLIAFKIMSLGSFQNVFDKMCLQSIYH